MREEHTMTRDTVITALLILIGIVLALILFSAGAIWRGKHANASPRIGITRLRDPIVILRSVWVSYGGFPGPKDGGDVFAQA